MRGPDAPPLVLALALALAACGADGLQPGEDGAGRVPGGKADEGDTERDCPPSTGAATNRHMWVWDGSVATEAAPRDALLAFARARGVATIYLHAPDLLVSARPALAAFLDRAAAECVSVELLFGQPSWALPEHHGDAVALARAAVELAREHPGATPVGVHYDVEPYALPEWSADPAGTAQGFVDLVGELGAALADSGLELTMDLPFWFDEVAVARGDETRPLSEWAALRAERVVVMAYRDHAAAPDGVIDLAATELAAARALGKEVVLGVETGCGLEPEKVTFCEEGAAALDAALAAAAAAYADNPALVGFAIHDYGAYRVLGP